MGLGDGVGGDGGENLYSCQTQLKLKLTWIVSKFGSGFDNLLVFGV